MDTVPHGYNCIHTQHCLWEAFYGGLWRPFATNWGLSLVAGNFKVLRALEIPNGLTCSGLVVFVLIVMYIHNQDFMHIL